MNIGQNILNAFDIMLEKRLQDAFSTTPQIIIAEISNTNIFANTYSIKYQGQEYSNVISNNNMIYSLGDIVQVLTDNSNYIIVGCLSQTGSQALYQDYLAQLAFDKTKVDEALADDALEIVLYSRLGKINHGVSEATVENFNKALQEAIRARCQASVIFEGAQSSETCSIEVIINSVAYSTEENNENEEEIKATRKIILSFNDLQNNPQQTQQDTVNLSSELGEWKLETVTFKRSQATIGASIKELYLTAESDTSSLANQMTMIIDSEKTIFEADEDVTELTQTVKIKNPTGSYFYTPGMKYLWGAEEPTVVSQDSERYNDLLGEGWASLSYTESQSYDLSINHIPGTSRRFKCVALTDNNQAIANGIVELVNARNPQVLPELKIEYTTTQATITPQSGTYSYWVQKMQNEEYVAHGKELDNIIDVKNIATINFVNSVVCSIYDQADKYLGSQAIFVFSDSANADSSLANERKKWIVVKDRATDTTYFDEDDIEWYNSPEEAFTKAYNGRDGKTRTHNGETKSALRELDFQQDDAGNYIPPFGYYLWRQTFKLWNNGVTSITRQLEAPEKPWVKEIEQTKEYYILSTAIEEPEKPTIDKTDPTSDGHEYIEWKLDENGWAESVEDVSAQYPRKWQTIVTWYTDDSIAVSQQSALVDIYTEETEEDVTIEKIELNIDDTDITAVKITVDIKYNDTLPHYGKYEFTLNDRPEMADKIYSSSGSYYLAWSDTNDAVDNEVFVDGENFNYNQHPQGAYLWLKLTVSVETETDPIDVLLPIATTLGLARNFKSSTVSYAVGTKDTIPTSGWDTDFELVAKKLDNINTYIWTATKTEYTVTLTATEFGTDQIELNPSKDEGASKVLSWAVDSDTTFIDGAKIYTGSINADKLDVTSLNAVAADIAGWKIGSQALYKGTTLLSSYQSGGTDQRIAVGGLPIKEEVWINEPFKLSNIVLTKEYNSDGNETGRKYFEFSIVSDSQPLPQMIDNDHKSYLKINQDDTDTYQLQINSNGWTTEDTSLLRITLDNEKSTAPRWRYKAIMEGTYASDINVITEMVLWYKTNETIGLSNSVFQVLSDGSMYATEGEIAGWTMKNDYLMSPAGTVNGKDYYSIFRSKWGTLASDVYPVLGIGINNNEDSDTAPFKVMLDGSMYATKGKIGNFTIGSSSIIGKHIIEDQTQIRELQLCMPTSDRDSDHWFAVRTATLENGVQVGNSSWPFWISQTGILYATGAQITGNSIFHGQITATAGGSIAGWTIEAGALSNGTLGSSGIHLMTTSKTGAFFGNSNSKNWMFGIGSNFGITNTGDIHTTGNIYLNNSGAIRGGSIGAASRDSYVYIRTDIGISTSYGEILPAGSKGYTYFSKTKTSAVPTIRLSDTSWQGAGYTRSHQLTPGHICLLDNNKEGIVLSPTELRYYYKNDNGVFTYTSISWDKLLANGNPTYYGSSVILDLDNLD